MERRSFLRDTVAGVAGAGLIAGCGTSENAGSSAAPAVHTDKKVRWRLASSFPRSLDTIYGASDVLAERVSAMSGGNFEIRPYPGGEIVPALEVMDAAQQGTVEIAQTCSYYFKGKHPALVFDTAVPFGLNARQQSAWLSHGGGQELIRKLYAQFNIINFSCGNTGCQMGGWFKKEINQPDDIRGLKMRIPGLGGEVMSRLGAVVQVIAGGEILPALERGTIDATEWIGPYDDEKLGFYKVAKLYYYPGWWEPGPNITLQVNKDAWEALPKQYQEIFQAAAAEARLVMQERYDYNNAAALQRLLGEGVQLKPFSPEILAAAKQATDEILAEESAKDATYREIYEAWKPARAAAFQWFGTAELAYSRSVFGA
ncbi:TRAP transporter substrate-binding protein [Haliangium ochraceum]|uniref:Extracellular solute-binding protein n=1 Tax=Haliangium ochraceum (strain DSM 14365 / JCM 11303 / SMP-2) TaxID=502025 RepID=D0LSU8_HALO1|nr:TRAP transporter substrate-binding protein [Haliangium ochraceum]ACY17320.1 Extracellular solute-binding protein [Haliangium ochraceum DSM 14365]